MRLSKTATIAGIICSLPWVTLATISWIDGAVTSRASSYEAGDIIYFHFGLPLTKIVWCFKIPPLQDSDNWWAIPLLNVLFIFQWLIWAQLIALFVRLYKYLNSL